MPYRFGEDRQADACWLNFLDPAVCPVPQQRALLQRDIVPISLLDDPVPLGTESLALSLRQGVCAGAVPSLVNDIDPEQSVQLLVLGSSEYPALLAECEDAPPALFAVGDVACLNQPAVAVVGSRRASPLGLELSRRFSQSLAGAGMVIASGLALGVDGMAHQGALDAAGKSIAVLPTGVDCIYPRRHRALARDTARNGVVVSEFMPGTSPRKGNFHRRNRTLSGLALGALVIEAGRPSGSLITANAAAAQGRDVFALPWSLAHAGGIGCLHLLAEGATLVRSPGELLAQLLPGMHTQAATDSNWSDLHIDQQAGGAILAALGDELLSTDGIARRCGVSVSACLRRLAMLELAGRVERQQGLWIRTGA